MCKIKFMLFVGLFLVCGFVNAEMKDFDVSEVPLLVEKVEDTPHLDILFDLTKVGDFSYNVYWKIQAATFDSEQTKAMANSASRLSLNNGKADYELEGSSIVTKGGQYVGFNFAKWPSFTEDSKAYLVHYKISKISADKEELIAEFDLGLQTLWAKEGPKVEHLGYKGSHDTRWNVELTLSEENPIKSACVTITEAKPVPPRGDDSLPTAQK